jgi:hypothetical protein
METTMTGTLQIRLLPALAYMLRLAVVAAMLGLGVPAAFAQGASDPPTIYRLNPGSSFQQGCFPPCLCPVLRQAQVRGTFVLVPTGFDGLFQTFDIADVNWTASVGDSDLRITGSGTYKVGGEVALQQQLALDLKVGDAPVQHFDSGLVSGGSQFPDISVTISIHGQVCFDTVLGVDTSPVPAEQIHPYALLPESTFQQGCFPPCLCPVGVLQPISGTFVLVDLAQGPLFTEFAVVNVDWLVAPFSGASGSAGTPVSGFGIYRVGGEFAAQQQLGLDLRVGEAAQVFFDSGLGLGGGDFPRIDIVVSVNGGACHDIVIDLHALPADEVTSATRRGPANSWISVFVNEARERGVRAARPAGDASTGPLWHANNRHQVGNCMTEFPESGSWTTSTGDRDQPAHNVGTFAGLY